MHFVKRAGPLLGSLLLLSCEAGDDHPLGGGPSEFLDASFGGGADLADAGGLPPEEEVELPFEAPQAGRSSVYVPNPGSHRVAVVNASTFAVETIRDGLAPTYAATVPGQDVAVVINVGSGDATILRTVDGKTSSRRLPLGHDPNAIAIAPDGKHAVVYFDARLGTSGTRSFQDVTVLSLMEGQETARGVSVGFRPHGVQFSADGAQAFVITEDGISVIELTASELSPTIAQLVSLGDRIDTAQSADTQVLPDGQYAITRRPGDGSLRLVELASGMVRSLSLAPLQRPAPPADAGSEAGAGEGGLAEGALDGGLEDGAVGEGGTLPLPPGVLDISDLDVSPDGSFALAVVRNAGALLRIPIPGGFEDPSQVQVTLIPDVLVGSVTVSKDGSTAALYTTAAAVEALVLVDLTGASAPRPVRLRKAVRAVGLSASGSRAFVLHAPSANNSGDSEEMRIDASEGYSLVDVASGFPKLQLTAAAVRERDLLVTPDEQRVFTLLRDDREGVRELQMADLASFQVRISPLAKAPTSIGVVPGAQRVFIGQQNEGGMITFVDWSSGDIVHAVSGFELSGRVRQ